MKEETLHALFGVFLINTIKEEQPEWFNEDFYAKLHRACKKAYEAEAGIIDWIFEYGDLEFIGKEGAKEFVKHRFNESVKLVGGSAVFEINETLLSQFEWFNEEIYAELNTDFFHKKPVTYAKFSKSITEQDLF
jgi:ribonucleoside-diphosphate reductase beta chain